jgi:hypothetical protein
MRAKSAPAHGISLRDSRSVGSKMPAISSRLRPTPKPRNVEARSFAATLVSVDPRGAEHATIVAASDSLDGETVVGTASAVARTKAAKINATLALRKNQHHQRSGPVCADDQALLDVCGLGRAGYEDSVLRKIACSADAPVSLVHVVD